MKMPTLLAGQLRISVTAPEPAALAQALTDAGIRLRRVRLLDEFTLEGLLSERDLPAASALARKRGWRMEVLGKDGVQWRLRRLLRRRVLMAGIGLFLLWSAWVPGRVFFFEVEGNRTVPTRLILEQAERSGLGFGCRRSAIRSEQIKNHLLEAIPALQWAGINTRGCVATVTVRERSRETSASDGPAVSSIVALRDAVVIRCQALQGQAMVLPGQAVRQGQILISGFTDCGRIIRAQRARGEVFGQTMRRICVKIPEKISLKAAPIASKTRFALCIGKKRINFYKDGGNLPLSCDKIVSYYGITLPGGFPLPVQLVKERLQRYETEQARLPETEARRLLRQEGQRLLLEQMTAGRILHEGLTFEASAGCYRLEGSSICTELIGREQTEEFFK